MHMRKFTLLLTMVLGVFAANGQSCDDLFFSEYGEGSSNHKYIEIYNPSASAISLTGYTVYMSGNGGSYTNTFTTNATIASGDVYVVSTNQADSLIQAEADTVLGYPSIVHFNGDDALILYNGTDTVDVIGVPGVDPGSSWAVGTGSTANHTLVRKSSVTGGSTNWTTGATEWDVYSQNTWTYIGSHSSSCIVTPYVVTFMVNTANITVGTNGLYLGGGVIGGANAVQLADPDGDGVYVGTDTLNGSNGGNFIFLNSPANASDWNAKENLANLPCADAANYNDRILPTFSQDTTLMFCFGTCSTDTSCTVTSTNVDVTFRVDMNSVSASFTNVYVSGTLNSWSGNANQLTDPDGDGVYEADISLAPGSYEYKFTYDNWVGQESLDATLDSACTLTTGSFTNRYVTIPNATTVLPVVCWEECSSCAIVVTGCDELYFSEYGEGSSNHKYIEIYNPTANAISLTGYTVYMSGNGGSYTNTFTTNATIASGDVYVVSTNQADSLIQAEADTVLGYPSIVHFNGDDALILYNGTDTVDVIGVPGVDPGSSWAVGTGSTANHTLVRKNSITEGSIDWTTGATEWDVYAQNTWTYVGSHSSSCITVVVPTGCSELYFSEYAEGSSNHKYIEIYNPTANAVSLTGYTVYQSGNGGSYTNTFTTNASIASGDVYLISTNQADASILAVADTALAYPSIAHFNGDDAMILFNGTDTVDVIGVPGVDPGSSWIVDTGSTANYTLVRKDSVTGGSTNWTTGATQWDVYPQNTWTNAGSHTSSCIVITIPNVTFRVDMNNVTASYTNVYVSGTINGWSGNANQLTDANGDGVYEGTIPLTAGSYEYKFTYDNWVGQESLDATLDSACTLTTSGFTNRYVTIPNANTVLPVVCWEDCSSCPVYAPTYTIANVDGVDADGVADSLNVYCKLVGTVMGVDMQGAATMVQFTIHDGTGGMGVFSSVATAQNYTVTEGDQVRMIGSIGQFNGLTQMYPDSIVFISAGNTLPTAVVVTALGESTESELVTFENMVLVDPSQWSGSGSGFNVDATNGTDTIAVRIDNDVDLYSQPAPTGTFNVSGIGGQYDSSLPHLSGYQLLPRYIADIVPGQPAYSPKLVVSEIMSGSNASAWAADWFEIHNYGDTVVDLTGFSWDDESGISGTSVFPAMSIAAGEAIVVWNDVAANEDSLLVSWKLTAGSVQVISTDELNGSFPSLSQNGDGVYLFDASGTDLTNSLYLSATAGYTVEFDTTGMATGVAVDGVNGAYTSSLGDVGSPGNLAPNQNVGELGLMGRIYPNPTTGSFQIEMKQADRYAVEVMDIRGVVLTTVSVEGSVIPVELNASAGMYLVRVTSAKGTVTQRIQLL